MLNFNTVSAVNPKSRLQPRAEASLFPVAFYGSINPPLVGTCSQSSTTVSKFFPLSEDQVLENAQRTHFIEIPKDVLNHIAGFLGYNETLKGLLPTSAKLFVTVMGDSFKIRMNMPMPDRTNLIHEACYVDLKKMQMEELNRQIQTQFGGRFPEIFDRFGSHYWQGGAKFSLLTFVILFSFYIYIVRLTGFNSVLDSNQMSFFILGSVISMMTISSIVGALCSKPNASKLKENIESVKKSECFRRETNETNPSIRVRLRFKAEQENHLAFLRLYEDVKKKLERTELQQAIK